MSKCSLIAVHARPGQTCLACPPKYMAKYAPLKRTIEQVIETVHTASIYLHSLICSTRLGSLGKSSLIEFPIKLASPELVSIGNNVRICSGAWLNAKDSSGSGKTTLFIGDNTYIGRMLHINAWQKVTIESNVLIGERVSIFDASHNYSDIRLPIRMQGDSYMGRVLIRSGSWIGSGSVIMPGIKIGVNSVVGANSVVTRDVPDYSIVAGNPARLVKKITPKNY